MDYLGIIAIVIAIIGFGWNLIDRSMKEGAYREQVKQLKTDVDHAHERCRLLETGAASSDKSIAILSTKIDGLACSINEIKVLIENMRPKSRGGV